MPSYSDNPNPNQGAPSERRDVEDATSGIELEQGGGTQEIGDKNA